MFHGHKRSGNFQTYPPLIHSEIHEVRATTSAIAQPRVQKQQVPRHDGHHHDLNSSFIGTKENLLDS